MNNEQNYITKRDQIIDSINPAWNHVVHKSVFEQVYDAGYKQSRQEMVQGHADIAAASYIFDWALIFFISGIGLAFFIYKLFFGG
jgi:hypothetical protein